MYTGGELNGYQQTNGYLQTNSAAYNGYGTNNNLGYQPAYGGGVSMGGGMPMMNFGTGMTLGGVFNGTYLYSGGCMQLQTRLETITDQQVSNIRDVNLNISGIQVTEGSPCCLICTIIWGSIIIIPLFFMCCDWWLRIVNPSFQIPIQCYNSLNALLRSPSLTHLNLIVQDNYFDAQKAQALLTAVRNSNLRSFTFINVALFVDSKNREASDFRKNMAPFKTLKTVTQIRWGNHLL